MIVAVILLALAVLVLGAANWQLRRSIEHLADALMIHMDDREAHS